MCNARAGVWDARIETVRGFGDAITERDVDAGLALCHEEVELFSLTAQLEARTCARDRSRDERHNGQGGAETRLILAAAGTCWR